MARYTYANCGVNPRRSKVTDFLLSQGQSCSWLVGNMVITVTVSGCSQTTNKVFSAFWSYIVFFLFIFSFREVFVIRAINIVSKMTLLRTKKRRQLSRRRDTSQNRPLESGGKEFQCLRKRMSFHWSRMTVMCRWEVVEAGEEVF